MEGLLSRGSKVRILPGAPFPKEFAENLPILFSIKTDARWRLVETAWELGVSLALLAVSHDPVSEALFVVDARRRRKSITGARDALSGYQKGHCFYCFDTLRMSVP